MGKGRVGRARAWVREDAGLERGSHSRCGLFLPEERPSPLVERRSGRAQKGTQS